MSVRQQPAPVFPAFAPGVEIAAARRLAARIRYANWLSKHANTNAGRAQAYRLKARQVSHGLMKFPRWFRILSYEQHQHLGLLLVVQLADFSRVHIPYDSLHETVRETINVEQLPSRRTLPLAA